MFNFFFLLKDLDSYASGYTGLAKIRRLQFVAKHCPGLQEEALKWVICHAEIISFLAVFDH